MKISSTLLPILSSLALSAALTACVEVDMSDEALLAEGAAELSLEWVIVQEGTAISCVDAGASEIEIAILGDSESRQRTSCFGGFAVVDTLASGSSFVEVSLIAPNGNHLVTVELGEVELVAGSTVPLGAVELKL